MEGYKSIFDNAEKTYLMTGPKLENFRHSRDIYGFCINVGNIDMQSINYALNINSDLCKQFMKQPKGITGYSSELEYVEIDDLDSKHILQLTYLFDKTPLQFNRIVEIGGGFGNMCRLCKNIIQFNNWDIIDLPHMLELQKYYLENEIKDISNINFVNAHSMVNYSDTIDLVIGNHSVSELSWDIFINYFQNVILKSKFFYMGYAKYLPNPVLIQNKLNVILNNGFTVIKEFDYTEILHGAHVSYTLFKNNKF